MELHDKAWNLLKEKGLKLSQMMMIRSSFVEWSGYKDGIHLSSAKEGFIVITKGVYVACFDKSELFDTYGNKLYTSR